MNHPVRDAGGGAGLMIAFLVGDALLLTVAWLVLRQAHRPMLPYETLTVAAATALAAGLGVWPFVLRQRAAEARAARDQLAGTLAQLRQLEEVADRIGLATSQWQTVQEKASGAVQAAREIAGRLTEEQQQVGRLIEQGQRAEVQHLELEVNKLRRAEADWLQALVRIMDHVYALYTAAMRSAQPQLIEQMGAFQHACREAARRVGLVPLVVSPGTPFDPEAHQLLDPRSPLPDQPLVAAVVGTGYTFQGQPLRRIVVAVQPGAQFSAAQPAVSGEAVVLSSAPSPEAGDATRAPDDNAPSAVSARPDDGQGTLSFTMTGGGAPEGPEREGGAG